MLGNQMNLYPHKHPLQELHQPLVMVGVEVYLRVVVEAGLGKYSNIHHQFLHNCHQPHQMVVVVVQLDIWLKVLEAIVGEQMKVEVMNEHDLMMEVLPGCYLRVVSADV